MALSVPFSLIQFPGYFTDLDGAPLAAGSLQFYAAGTTTPQDVYADCNGDATLTNPVVLDSSGFAQIFLGSAGLYDVVVSDSTAVELYTIEGVGNPGQILFASLGNLLATGSQNVDSGYSILSTDQFVTVTNTSNTNPWIVNLPAASTRSTATSTGNGLPLTIKNLSAFAGTIVPNGADTIEVDNAAFSIPAQTGSTYPSVILLSNGTSGWWVQASHGL